MDQILEALLAYDATPPNEVYSHIEYGEASGEGISSERAVEIVKQCWKCLPATLAESFLEGFLQSSHIEGLDSILFNCIASAREVGSASSIVRLLQSACSLDANTIALRSIDALNRTADPSEQDRLAYALWVIVPAQADALKLSSLLECNKLSSYAKTLVQESIASCQKTARRERR